MIHAALLATLLTLAPTPAQPATDRWVVALSPAPALHPLPRERVDRLRTVRRHLMDHATASQRAATRALQAQGLSFESYWISNLLVVDAPVAMADRLRILPGVIRVYREPRLTRSPEPPAVAKGTATTANLALIRVPAVWALGVRGAGAVVAGADTGFDWTHPALTASYRGRSGDTVDHDHHWHDAVDEASAPCAPGSTAPCDSGTHGTQTMGIMVGDDGAGNAVGVAPEARWIGCRNMGSESGTLGAFLACFQWFMAPTALDGGAPRPELAPHVINNSWVCVPSEGCGDVNDLLQAVSNTRAAGIVVVGAGGNSGPDCSTITLPPAIYASTLTVGAADSAGSIADFSSRGPVTADGSGRRKPDLVAPGVDIRSTQAGGGYRTGSGTSYAAPHVAGVIALMISVNPALAGDVDTIETLLLATARPPPTVNGCDSADTVAVNNVYGLGVVDALAAVVAADRVFANGYE